MAFYYFFKLILAITMDQELFFYSTLCTVQLQLCNMSSLTSENRFCCLAPCVPVRHHRCLKNELFVLHCPFNQRHQWISSFFINSFFIRSFFIRSIFIISFFIHSFFIHYYFYTFIFYTVHFLYGSFFIIQNLYFLKI